MARILLSAPDNRPWNTGRHLAAALRDLGHEAVLLSFRGTPHPSDDLLSTAAEFRPVLHVMWKGETYRPEAVQTLRRQGIYTVLWHPDATVPPWLAPLAGASDLVCVQSRGMLDAFRAAGIADPQWLMEGVTPSCFACDAITERERQRYGCEVVLIGTVGNKPEYRKRLLALNRLVREGVRVRWWGPRLMFWRNSWGDWLSPAARSWGRRHVWNDTFAKACRCARIYLNLPAFPEVPGGLSNNAFMVTALGTLYLSLYRQGMEEFFEPGREVAVFRDEGEMADQVRRYLASDEERQAVAGAGQRRTLAEYTNHQAFRRLFKLIAERGGPVL